MFRQFSVFSLIDEIIIGKLNVLNLLAVSLLDGGRMDICLKQLSVVKNKKKKHVSIFS